MSNKRVKINERTLPGIVERFLKIASRGFCEGAQYDGKFCVEAAISIATGESDEKACLLDTQEVSDQPTCVPSWLSDLKIELNDEINWNNDKERADRLKAIGIAQLGSKGVITAPAFWNALSKKILATNMLGDYSKDYLRKCRNFRDRQYTIKDELLSDKQVALKVIPLIIEVLTEAGVPGAVWLKRQQRLGQYTNIR
jgi:hypothetical protein